MGLSWMPDAPAPPDPYQVSGAQTGQNIGTAVVNTAMGNMNQVTPYGSLTYSQAGIGKWQDPATGQVYSYPRYTATTKLNPEAQRTFNLNQWTQQNLAETAGKQSDFLSNYLPQGISTAGLPGWGDVPTAQGGQTVGSGPAMAQMGTQGAGLNGAPVGFGNITQSYGDPAGYAQQRQRVEEALMSRLRPEMEQQRQAQEASLANQGIAVGSRAYSAANQDLAQAQNDQRTSVLLAGGQEQSRLAGLDAARAGFQNQAQAQGFGQAMDNRALGNQTAQQNWQNLLAAMGFNNQAGQQQFQNQVTGAGFNNNVASTLFGQQMQGQQAQDAQRAQMLQEMFGLRNQPINEITALLSGSQVQVPNFSVNRPATVAPTDVSGNIWNNYAGQQANYNTQLGQWNNTMGGLFGLGAAGFGML